MSEAVHHFEAQAARYAQHAEDRPEFRERFDLWVSAIDRIASSGTPLIAIDLGSGPGHLTQHLIESGVKTTSIDASPAMLDFTKQRLERSGITAMDLRNHSLPLPSSVVREFEGKAHLIVLSSVLEYIEDDDKVLRQCAQMLRDRKS